MPHMAEEHLFWITSRAAGVAALLFSSAAVAGGPALGGRLLKGRRPDLRVTHESLSLATMGALVVHAVALLFDSFLKPSIADIAIPFASSYKEPWMATGIVGGWMMILLGLSYYLRGRIGLERWRRWHRFTALAWLLGMAHALGEGTDAGRVWFVIAVGIVAIPATGLLLTRHIATKPVAS